MGPVIGIDFGTTNSLCAWLDGERPAIIPNVRGDRSTPSVVAMTARGETLVGESAKNQAYINPENTIAGVKRLLGGEGLLSMGGKLWRAEEIVALVLGSLRHDAEKYLGTELDRAVITAPAHFSDRERRALTEAGRLAGLEVVRIVNEPTAAAIARSWESLHSKPASETTQAESLVLVYDYGGGTFDVTVLERSGADCRVLSSRGDGRLGGGDLDRELRRLAAERFKAEGLDLESDRFLAQELASQAERAKIELSERESASIALAFASSGGKILHPIFELGRDEFEGIALPYVERSLELVDKALSDAKVGPGELGGLVLSGGSSRIPLVRRLLKERLGLEPEGGVNPEEIVALGAAVSAALASDEVVRSRMRVRDVVSRSYGVEIDGGAFVPVVRKNSPVPSTSSRVFTTIADDQDSVEIHVLQGESRLAAEDLSLGRFLLAGIGSAKAGVPRVRVDFSIDESDMLHVSAVDLESGAQQAISIADIGRGASDETADELSRKSAILIERLGELREGLKLERGLEAELDDAVLRARRVLDADSISGEEETCPRRSESELRLLKAELEGLVGELLARRSEVRADERRAKTRSEERDDRGRAPRRGLGERT